MDKKDYYKVLDVGESATADEIKKSYRNLAFRYHPDKNPGGQELMKEINEAYAVLSNPEKRQEYDNLRQSYGSFARDHYRQTHTEEDIFRNSDVNQIFEELSRVFGFTRPEDLFSRDAFYGRNYREFKFKGPGVSAAGIFFGSMGNVYHPGAGAADNTISSKLMLKTINMFQKMAAKRLGIVLPERGRDLFDSITVTPAEASSGVKMRYTVNHSARSREIMITVPAGIKEGQKIKLRGLGKEGKNGGEAGDLFLKVRFRKPFLARVKGMLRR